jgi:hypothetical protein
VISLHFRFVFLLNHVKLVPGGHQCKKLRSLAEPKPSDRTFWVDHLIEVDVEWSNLFEGGGIVLFAAVLLAFAAVVLGLLEGVDHEVVDSLGQRIGVLAADVQRVVVEVDADCVGWAVPRMRLLPMAKVVSMSLAGERARERVRMGSFS